MLGVCAAGLPGAAHAQDFVDQANAAYRDIRRGANGDPGLRSDLMILPVLAKMAPPPRGVESIDKAILRTPTGPLWKPASDWAAAPEQQAVLAEVRRAGVGGDFTRAPAFGQPYGVEALAQRDEDLEFIADGLYTELDVGGTPMLVGAQFKYLEHIRALECLVHVEVTRLEEAGEPTAALELLVAWVNVSRQLGDRAFAEEKLFGFASMSRGVERMRDVAYTDFKGQRRLRGSPEVLASTIAALAEVQDDGKEGYLNTKRFTLPRANLLAAQQAAEMLLGPDGPRGGAFSGTMARLSAKGNPLRMFSEVARWETLAADHAGRSVTLESISRVWGDFERRWKLDNLFDPIMSQRFDLMMVPLQQQMLVALTMIPVLPVFDARTTLRVELVGTRHALALVGVYYRNGDFPNDLSGIRPTWLKDTEHDPFNPKPSEPMHYFVPGRNTPTPVHDINVISPRFPNFRKGVKDGDFVLCSVGFDGERDYAREVQNTAERTFDTDYLIWPPVVSLQREEVVRTRQ